MDEIAVLTCGLLTGAFTTSFRMFEQYPLQVFLLVYSLQFVCKDCTCQSKKRATCEKLLALRISHIHFNLILMSFYLGLVFLSCSMLLLHCQDQLVFDNYHEHSNFVLSRWGVLDGWILIINPHRNSQSHVRAVPLTLTLHRRGHHTIASTAITMPTFIQTHKRTKSNVNEPPIRVPECGPH